MSLKLPVPRCSRRMRLLGESLRRALFCLLPVLHLALRADGPPSTNALTRERIATGSGRLKDPVPGRLVGVAPTNGFLPAATNGARLLLNFDSIIRLVYAKNPTVRAAREEMEAARHGLDEFRANLSRLEPFIETRSDLSDFPSRRRAFGNTLESVVGVKKETFDGSVLSTEVGGSYSRFEFGSVDPTQGQEAVESGGGALVRARLEMPFFGSRRRQDRIISQAFQESTARKAQLDYLKNYRTVTEAAIEYYNEAVYYRRLIESYDRYLSDLNGLIEEPRLAANDRSRVESVRGGAETTRNIYMTRWKEDLQILRGFVALDPEQEMELDVPEYRMSPLAAKADQPGELHALLQQARENNPAFAVLRDAKNNAELQRQRAVKGRYDVTAFLEGTTFPVGSESFDDRYQGWTVGGGVNLRLNDRRVLKHTQLKAESEIRQFEAEIEAEELLVRRRITTETQGLLENDHNRAQILEVVRQKAEEFKARRADFFAGRINIDQLIETRAGLTGMESNLGSNLYNSSNREARLLLATGRVYEVVGLKVRHRDTETHPRSNTSSGKKAP